MPKRLGKFELPSKLTKVEEGATPTYAKFIAEPFEAGYGHTIGNSLRRVLLSSLEGAAITSIKVDGAMHEFATVPSYPASHGCVRIPHAEAQAVWQFGRTGMRVWTRA